MLVTLRQIMQQVRVAPTLDEALAVIIEQVKKAVPVDACAVYLTDVEQEDCVLAAAEGLTPDSIGSVRAGLGEGLVGLVAERKELIVETDAGTHPSCRLSTDTLHRRDGSFLGTPLIHYRKLLGVLVAWKPAHQPYTRDEVTFFLSLGAQLAKAVHDAETIDAVSALLAGRRCRDPFVQGLSAASGLAIGRVVLVDGQTKLASIPDRAVRDAAAEVLVFEATIAAARQELRSGGEGLAGVVPEDVESLFDVYAMLLGNDSLVLDSSERIRSGNWAPGAWRETISRHAAIFEQMEDPYLRTRADDIRELGEYVLTRLLSRDTALAETPERCVLVGDRLGLTHIAAIPAGRLAGLVSTHGSPLSHMAVLARALGIPAVVSLAAMPSSRLAGSEMVVDGEEGRVYIRPSPELLAIFQERIRDARLRAERLATIRELPAETLDGTRIRLYANIGLPADIASATASGAEGIGLYRTEYSFLLSDTFPGEDDQLASYREVLAAFAPKPVTLRTLDVGGDKMLSYLPAVEDNPFLGCRGIRFSLDQPEIFLIQLRAMLRANAGLGNLQVLFPMIGTVGELDEALGLLERAYRELQEEGQDAARPRVGVMIEVPASVHLSEILIRQVDFLSIGTNDLTQYMLAVDRNNAQVVTPYDGLHPAVLNAIRQVIEAAHRQGKPVSVCGEMAGDPAGALLLLGMGADALSMSPALLAEAKLAIRCFTRGKANLLAVTALGMDDGFSIHRLVNGVLDEIRNCSEIAGVQLD
jgi:phosphotransferase system enzyme I (PtsP)